MRKTFNGHHALNGLDLRVPAGSIFGFLGRNGAGKTTTMKLLMGLLRADSGEVRLFGSPFGQADPDVAIRRRIGFVTEEKELYPYMTVGQIIRFTRPLFPGWRDDLETAAIILLVGAALWMLFPVIRTTATPLDAVQHLLVVFVCGLGFYGLSVLTATVLDDTWHMWSSTLIMVLWAPPVRRLLPPAFDVFRPFADASPLVADTLPWMAMALSVVAGSVFVLAALKIVKAQEY